MSFPLFQPVICRLNFTRIDIDYDVPCDLPEYFECVDGKLSLPGPPLGHLPSDSNDGPHFGSPGFDGDAAFDAQPVFYRDHSSTTSHFPEEGPRRHAAMGFCRQVNLDHNKAVRSTNSGPKQTKHGWQCNFRGRKPLWKIQISLMLVCQSWTSSLTRACAINPR